MDMDGRNFLEKAHLLTQACEIFQVKAIRQCDFLQQFRSVLRQEKAVFVNGAVRQTGIQYGLHIPQYGVVFQCVGNGMEAVFFHASGFFVHMKDVSLFHLWIFLITVDDVGRGQYGFSRQCCIIPFGKNHGRNVPKTVHGFRVHTAGILFVFRCKKLKQVFVPQLICMIIHEELLFILFRVSDLRGRNNHFPF